MSPLDAMVAAGMLDQNFAELLAWYASWPGGVVEKAPDVWRCHSGVAFRAINAATRIRLDPPGRAAARIDAVNAWFQERGQPWRWLVGASSRPGDLDERLIAGGLERIGDNPGMALDLAAFRPEAMPTAISMERVVDEPGLVRWREVQRKGVGLDPVRDEAWWIAHRRPGFADDHPLQDWVASVDGEPVAAAALFVGGGVAGIYNVATVPEARGRGYGRAVTTTALVEGQRRGLPMAVLGSSELGLPVYRRLGFVEVSRLRSYAPG